MNPLSQKEFQTLEEVRSMNRPLWNATNVSFGMKSCRPGDSKNLVGKKTDFARRNVFDEEE